MFKDKNSINKSTIASLFVILSAMIASGLIVGACGNGSAGGSEPGASDVETVSGIIRDVQAASFLELDSLTVEDGSGVVWVLEGRGIALPGFNPSHLRDHMVMGLTVRVSYVEIDGSLLIVAIEDASSSGAARP